MDQQERIRAFGMSALQLGDELRALEAATGISGLMGTTVVEEENETALEQFESRVRSEAAEMAFYYQIFYCLEKSIRDLCSSTLSDPEAGGQDWWNSDKVPQNIKDEVKRRQKAELDSGVTVRSDQSIDYTTFGELTVLITANWDIFSNIISSKPAVHRILGSLNILRGPIAHCCPLAETEKDRLLLTIKDWSRLLG
ncbi:Swt1 family HEPN domain-containing protein [Parvularcula maris]|uniref:Swt1 family HEPN domain-containing protein n=1 Tax=Parvularcula maris TaxID=2965077 RepID=A0A9X2L8W0_9PROT|nr:Swt1 family HEPN domain-containing protein [Parvularcula maris]MCQ8185269.1 Swt1 family HEPN domain-containing protein [Parvularcula maris]